MSMVKRWVSSRLNDEQRELCVKAILMIRLKGSYDLCTWWAIVANRPRIGKHNGIKCIRSEIYNKGCKIQRLGGRSYVRLLIGNFEEYVIGLHVRHN